MIGRAERVLAALGLAGVALVGPVGPGSPAAAAPTETPVVDATTTAQAQAGTTVELVEQPTWVQRDEPFETEVRVTGAPAGSTIEMVVHEAVETRREFRRTLEGELTEVRFDVPPQPVAAGPRGTMRLGFTPGDPGMNLPSRGVYPVEVLVKSAAGDLLDDFTTYLSFLTPAAEGHTPLDVAVLVDVAAPPALQPDGATVLPAETLPRALERIRVLEQTEGVPITLAPRPETIEGLARGGPTAAAAVEQLRSLAQTRPVFARPFVDVDLVALERAGLLPEANAQADGGANVVRNRLGVEPSGGMWMSGGNFPTDAARVIADLGIHQIVVPPSVIADDAAGDGSGEEEDGGDDAVPLAPVTLGEGGPLAMVTDPALADHLIGSDDMVAAHRFVAELLITWVEAPANPRGVVVHLPPDADIDPDVVATALGALSEGQATRAVPVEQVFQDVPPLEDDDGPAALELAPYEPTDDLSGIARRLRATRGRVSGVGALRGDPEVTADLEQSLLVSTGRDTPAPTRAAYVERADAELGSVSGAVSLPDEFRITLTSRSSKIPVRIANTSDQQLEVRVTLDSDQLEFPGGDELTQTLAASTTTQIDVPVRARTSGAFSLDITVTSPDGSIVLDTTRFDVRSTAISGVGLVLSIGACLFLAVWWAKHWRSARRSRDLVPADAVTRSGDPGSADANSTDATAAGGPVAGLHRSGPGVHAAPGGPGGSPGGPPGSGAPGRSGSGSDGPYRPAHMARQRTRSG